MNTLKLTLASAVALSLAACAGEAPADTTADETAVAEETTAAGTIVEVAQGDETLSTLVEAVTAAGLGTTLSGEGPFTVFAPTNDAFGKLPEGTVEKLTTEDVDTLTAVLKYHVVAGNLDAAAVTAAVADASEEGLVLETVGGPALTVTIVDGEVLLTDESGNTAKVIATDVEASNGVVHVIDTVLMPK